MMKLPIVAYGSPILRKVAKDVPPDYPDLHQLIEDMFETMYAADGLGLAAPQINQSIRLFVIDVEPYAEEDPAMKDFKKVFINPQIVEERGKPWEVSEGCLSIPHLHEEVVRPEIIQLTYFDEKWTQHKASFSGIAARTIQHEYDHLQGKLFIDRISPLRKRLLKSKLEAIAKGKIKTRYAMIFHRG